MRRPGARISGSAAALAVALAAACTVLLGQHGSVWAFPFGAVASALAAALSGTLLLVHASGTLARVFMGMAMLLWGAGQMIIGLIAASDPLAVQHATAGDALCVLASLAALGGILHLPLPDGAPGRRMLVLDAVLIAAPGAALVWQVSFAPLGAEGTQALPVLVVLADIAVVALTLQIGAVGLDRGTLQLAGAAAVFVAGDVVLTHGLVAAQAPWPYASSAIAVVAWPLAALGTMNAGDRPVRVLSLHHIDAGLRTGGLTTALLVTLSLSLFGVTLATSGGRLDWVTGALLCLLLVLLGVREWVNRRQRTRLVGDLREQALHDPLTGLGNRRALAEALLDLSAAAPGGRRSVAVLDLDGFKDLNERFGTSVGDRVLRAVAGGIAGALPTEWSAHRLGADEFVLVGPGGVEAAREVAQDVLAVVAAGLTVGGAGSVVVTASAGVAAVPATDNDPLDCLAEATTALREAKAAGTGRTVVHDGEVAARARRKTLVAVRLRDALARDGLDVVLQPIVDVTSERAVGFEVLSRWHDGELGRVGPDEFVAVAEESGLIVELGASALRQGVRALVSAGGVERRLRLSVNASPLELRSPGYVDAVRGTLLDEGFPSDLLTLEVTESTFMRDDDPAVAVLLTLARDGVRVAVDDFGTGYSSLSYLERLPVDVVKIDRSLVSGASAPRSRALLTAVVALCDALELAVVAEGVQEVEQARVLQQLGVSMGQGFLWAQGVRPDEVAALFDRPLGPSALPVPRGGDALQ